MKFGECYLKVIVLQTIAVLMILIAVLTTKFFFKSTFKIFSKWYLENVLDDTSVYEVIDNEI